MRTIARLQRQSRSLLPRIVAARIRPSPADAGLLVASEWRGRIENVEAVDPYRAGAGAVSNRVRLANVSRPNTRREAVRCVVRPLYDLIDVVELDDAHHRSKNLFPGNLHFILRVIQVSAHRAEHERNAAQRELASAA